MTFSRRVGRIGAAGLLAAAALAGALDAADTGRIAFVVDAAPDGRVSRIFVADADGGNARTLATEAGRHRSPAFSPDGRFLAYQTTSDLGLDRIIVQPVQGGAAHVVANGTYPQWSRDGKRILFSRRQLNEYQLCVAPADGSQRSEALKPIARGHLGRWSPDERRLAAVVPVIAEGQDRWQIQVMPSDRSEPNFRLTLPESFGQVVSLDWSPNGESLLFTSTRQAQHSLYRVDLQRPDPRRLPAGDAIPNAGFGSWSPDGRQILFRAAGDSSGALSRLCVMRADGTDVRTLWEPPDRELRVHGTAWHAPRVAVAGNLQVKPAPAPVAPPKPVPAPVEPVKPAPMPAPPPAPALGPPKKLHGSKLFAIPRERSPVSVHLAAPRGSDFVVSVPQLPMGSWSPRRQGVGVTVELEDGSLYRGTVIYSGVPWVTLQGRPKGGKVRLLDGKQLPPETAGFRKGFNLSLRREGKNLIIAVGDRDVLTRPVLGAAVKAVQLTLENFDPGTARFNLGNIYYRVADDTPAAPAP